MYFAPDDHQDEDLNPLDSLESVLSGYNWVFDRLNDEELQVKLSGKTNDYHVYFLWDDALHLMQICCQFDLPVDPAQRLQAQETIAKVNENLYLGHFFLPANSNRPNFRYSALIKNQSDDQARALINDLVDLSLAQCERCADAFALLGRSDLETAPSDHGKLDLALMETQGQS